MSSYQSINFKRKIDFSVSNDLSQPIKSTIKSKRIYPYEKCNECKKRRKPFKKDHKICRTCYRSNAIFKPIGNKIIDDFIKYTQCNLLKDDGKMESVPYDQFKDVEFIAEGGFSKVYKATWINGPIRKISNSWKWIELMYSRNANEQVVLKKLNNSKNITSKELLS